MHSRNKFHKMGKSEEIVHVYNDRWKTTLKIVENLKGKKEMGWKSNNLCVTKNQSLWAQVLFRAILN